MNKILFILFHLTNIFSHSLYAQNEISCNIFFESNKSNLSLPEQSKIKEFVKFFDTTLIYEISIFGYCDDVGNNGYNDSLSGARADHVRNFLVALNIKSDLITESNGRGEIALKQEGDKTADQQRASNRRAEIHIEYAIQEKANVKKGSILSNNQKIGDKVVLGDILFIVGRHTLLPESKGNLDILVNDLKENKKYHIVILGHLSVMPHNGDSKDYDSGLLNLSEARAKVIYDYLVEHGIDAARLDYKGLKGDFPTGKGPKYDRRVEIEITDIR